MPLRGGCAGGLKRRVELARAGRRAARPDAVAGVRWGSVRTVDQSLALLLLKRLTVGVPGGLDSLGGATARRFAAERIAPGFQIGDGTSQIKIMKTIVARARAGRKAVP